MRKWHENILRQIGVDSTTSMIDLAQIVIQSLDRIDNIFTRRFGGLEL